MKTDLRLKILNDEICRLCLDGESDLIKLDETAASGLRPMELIERFRLIKVIFKII